jgi:sigma-B regulation protein RsbU (phosphoserine phosphatase)
MNPALRLLITASDGSSKTIELQRKNLSLGRAADNELAYPSDPALSRYHLSIDYQDGGWTVRDCGSRNGTVVNSATLKATHWLYPGDRIYAGHLTIDVDESSANGTQDVVRFVSRDAPSKHGSTIITSLAQVMTDRAKNRTRQRDDSAFGTTRAVAALIRAGQELAGHRPLSELFDLILDLSLSAVEARRGLILISESGSLNVKASKGEGFSISTAIRDQVMREGSALLISDAQIDSALREQHSIVAQQVRSIMAVPLQTGQSVIGLIYVDNATIVRPFSQDDLELLTVMANVAAIRIEHARLAAVEQQEKLTQLALEQASEIQRSLLPSEPPVVAGYELAGFNLPCQAVGGDYYDFLPCPDGRIALCIGDVCGKGIGAALMMSSLQARVQMLAESAPDPAQALTALNRNLAPRFPVGRFITAFYGLLHPPAGALHYANAGHNYPLILRLGGAVEQLRGGGLVLGVSPDVQYALHKAMLAQGDLLVLYSDGATEALSPAGEQFGEKRLAEFLVSQRSRPCSQMIEKLSEQVRTWCGGAGFADDFTIVLVRRE